MIGTNTVTNDAMSPTVQVMNGQLNTFVFVFTGDQHAAVMYRVLIFIMAIWGVQGCSNSESCPTIAPNSSSKDVCYSARIPSTVLQGLPFGGVPTVLALDFMCFLVSPVISQKEPNLFINYEINDYKKNM